MREVDTSKNRCWAEDGIWGNSSCSKLASVIHCRNCGAFEDVATERLSATASTVEISSQSSKKDDERKRAHSLFIFKYANITLAIEPACVGEITVASPIHRIPHRVENAIDGISNINGELVLVVNIYSALSIEKTDLKDAKLNVLCQSGGEKFAFRADEVVGVKRVDDAEIRSSENVKSKFISGVFSSEKFGEVLILDVQLLAGAIIRRLI